MEGYVIYLENNEISLKYLRETLPHIRAALGSEPILWNGTTPFDLPRDELKFEEFLKPTVATNKIHKFTETKKAIWYSHFDVWNQIITKERPAWIFEHDIDLRDIVLLEPPKNYHIINCNYTGATDCYYLTPYAAQILVDLAKEKVLFNQVDTFLAAAIKNRKSVETITYITRNIKTTQLKHHGRVNED